MSCGSHAENAGSGRAAQNNRPWYLVVIARIQSEKDTEYRIFSFESHRMDALGGITGRTCVLRQTKGLPVQLQLVRPVQSLAR